ncbi:MAG: hypothetical protein V3V55_03995 [Rhodospirillales bacterium]
MKQDRRFRFSAISVAIFSAGLWLGSSPALAGETDTRTFQERKHDKANALREKSKDSAAARLGYDSVYSTGHARGIDFYTIGLQIARLAAIIQQLSDPAASGQVPRALPGLDLAPAMVSGMYGPGGPTRKSVRLLLEYRLMVAGNPRLTVGVVRDDGDKVIAQVTTADGSVVEEYQIDKKTGNWKPIR